MEYCGHLAKESSNEVEKVWKCYYCAKEFKTEQICKHHEESCDEQIEKWKCDYCVRTFTTHHGCRIHQRSCKHEVVHESSKKSVSCCKCGRLGHSSSECYARSHAQGYSM